MTPTHPVSAELARVRAEMYLPAHVHPDDADCVGCDLLRRLTGTTLSHPPDTGKGLHVERLARAMSDHEDAMAEQHDCDFGCAADIARLYADNRAALAAHQFEPPAGIRAVFGNEKGAVVRVPDVEHRRVDDRWRAARKDDFCVGCLVPWPCKFAAHQSEPKEKG